MKLPFGCVIQDMQNSYSKVTWIEHIEYDASAVHQLYQPLLSSGLGFGAQKWVASIKRQCEYFAAITASMVHSGNRVVHKWKLIQAGNAENTQLMIREIIGNPGEPSGSVLSAVNIIWLLVSFQHLFDFLRNEQTRGCWDVLSQDGPVLRILNIPKGQDVVNSISLLRTSAATSANKMGMLILQETCNDVSGSLVIHTAVKTEAMNAFMAGGDPSCVALLPSGFAILPDCFPVSGGPMDHGGGSSGDNSGSLLTIGF